jgi:hypothetical protein
MRLLPDFRGKSACFRPRRQSGYRHEHGPCPGSLKMDHPSTRTDSHRAPINPVMPAHVFEDLELVSTALRPADVELLSCTCLGPHEALELTISCSSLACVRGMRRSWLLSTLPCRSGFRPWLNWVGVTSDRAAAELRPRHGHANHLFPRNHRVRDLPNPREDSGSSLARGTIQGVADRLAKPPGHLGGPATVTRATRPSVPLVASVPPSAPTPQRNSLKRTREPRDLGEIYSGSSPRGAPSTPARRLISSHGVATPRRPSSPRLLFGSTTHWWRSAGFVGCGYRRRFSSRRRRSTWARP